MKHLLYIILLGLIMISCGGKEYATMQKRLQKLNEYNKADSVFHTTTEAQALVDYFEDHGTPNEKMLAYYLLGRAYYDIHEAPMALNSFQAAIEKADTTAEDCDYRQLSRVYGWMAEVFYHQCLYRQEIDCENLSEYYGWKGSDTICAIQSLACKIFAYKQLGKKDSAIIICKNVINMFDKIGYTKEAACYCSSIIRELIDHGETSLAKRYINRYEKESGYFDDNNIEKGRESYYYSKGYYYVAVNNLDSAEYYYRKELSEGKDFNNQNAGSRGLALLFQQKHMGDSAAKYALYSYEMNDSVYAQMATKEIEQIHGMYDYSRNQEIAQQEKERADHARAIIQLISVFSFLLIILAVYIAREIHKKRKKERAEYKNKVSLLAKTQADVIKLRSYGSELNQMLTAKENETTKLLAEIEKYKERIGQQKLSSDALLENSEAYILLKKTAAKALVLSEEEWQYAFMMVVDILPNFYKLISSKRLEFNDNEFKTCILLRLHFTSKDVANMLGVTQPYITKICRSLMQKLFKEDGKSKELTERLKQYS